MNCIKRVLGIAGLIIGLSGLTTRAAFVERIDEAFSALPSTNFASAYGISLTNSGEAVLSGNFTLRKQITLVPSPSSGSLDNSVLLSFDFALTETNRNHEALRVGLFGGGTVLWTIVELQNRYVIVRPPVSALSSVGFPEAFEMRHSNEWFHLSINLRAETRERFFYSAQLFSRTTGKFSGSSGRLIDNAVNQTGRMSVSFESKHVVRMDDLVLIASMADREDGRYVRVREYPAIELTWRSVAGKRYFIETRNNLEFGDWSDRAGPFSGTGEDMSHLLSTRRHSQEFYQVREE